VRFLIENLSPAFQANGRLAILTNLCVSNILRLSTDPRALRLLVQTHSQASIFHIPGLHAKTYIADETRAIVTSGNLTAGGLYRNLEYGIQITESMLIRQMRADLTAFANLGAIVPNSDVIAYSEVVDQLCEALRSWQRLAREDMQAHFRDAFKPIQDGLLRLRLAGGPIHSVFARTIEYLLRVHGPMTTINMHPMISSIHPDLCDDSVDRVIDGKRFGKKWKHAVRTAQQQLKQNGRVVYVNGKWALAEQV
jgi:hypothetical protein